MSKKIKLSSITPDDKNNNKHTAYGMDLLEKSVNKVGIIESITVSNDDKIISGNARHEVIGKHFEKEALVIETDGTQPIVIKRTDIESNTKEFYEASILANTTAKKNIDFDMEVIDTLVEEFDIDVVDLGVDIVDYSDGENEITSEIEDKEVEAHAKLTDTFIVPPFTILDTRQGYWNERKSYWKTLIKDNGESRENTISTIEEYSKDKGYSKKYDKNRVKPNSATNGVSILDPVLSELVNLWFGLPKSKTFDCFAGDSVFGYVSSYLGNSFTGIELRQEQADLNNERVKGFNAKYICDDGRNVLKHIEENSQDLLFSCPPYFDLEVYSDLENDASNQDSYEDFIKILYDAFTDAIKCLKNNRFAVITVGDVRDKQGFYYRFVDDIKDIFKRNNVLLYNELILVESIGTLPQRVGRFMEHRKIGKCHQNVLVFFKGNPKEIKNIYPKLESIKDESTNTQL